MDREAILAKLGDVQVAEFYKTFSRLKSIFREEMKFQFDRSLPLADELFDRWERAKFLGFGEGASIYDSAMVLGEVKVGVKTWIGPFTILDGSGKLVIGDYCNVSAGAQIYSHDSVKWVISGGESEYEYAETSVGHRCYIGPNAIIAKGVSLGDECIVGANSFVNRSFPGGSKIAGSPARLLS